MTINRIIHGGSTLKVNKVKICQEIKCDLPAQHMCKTMVSFLHKHLFHRKCKAIIDQLIIPKRKSSIIYVRKLQNGTYHGSLDQNVDLYNKLPTNVKAMKVGPFKRYLKNIKLNPAKLKLHNHKSSFR